MIGAKTLAANLKWNSLKSKGALEKKSNQISSAQVAEDSDEEKDD